jgi:Family of unknown function (DUF6289)
MSRIRSFMTVQVLIAALFVVIGAAIYVTSLPKSDAGGALVCSYYSDATYTHVVGARGTGCCGVPISWGVTTAYKKCQTLLCTQQLCNN